MDALMFDAFAVLGVVVYAATVLGSSVLALEAWSHGETRRMTALWSLWGLISLLQLMGLVAVQSGNSDPRLWYVNRLVWLAFGAVTLSMAWRAFRAWVRRVVDVLAERWLWPEREQ